MNTWLKDKEHVGYVYNPLTGQSVEDYTNRMWVGDRLSKFENDISNEELHKLLEVEKDDKEILISVYNGYIVEVVTVRLTIFRKLLLEECENIKYSSVKKTFIERDIHGN